jgi:hypothetical protein
MLRGLESWTTWPDKRRPPWMCVGFCAVRGEHDFVAVGTVESGNIKSMAIVGQRVGCASASAGHVPGASRVLFG